MRKDATSGESQTAVSGDPGFGQDQLEYLADHLLELQSLAGGIGGTTLNGLLMLAYQEARLQGRRLAENAKS